LFAPFLPHLCEDIYSQIFVDEFNQQYSIHARGNHADICDLHLNQSIDYDALGSRLLEIIFNVRKYKSQKNLSMKFMLNSLEIPNSYKLNSIVDDLANVCNSEKIIFSNCQELLIN
jgi:valyl-tRNA synthetase